MTHVHSHSSIDLFGSCPRQYAFRYIDKPEVDDITSAPIARGDVVHRIVQLLYAQGRDGIVLTKEQMLAAYAKGWEPYAGRGKVKITDDYKTIDDYERGGREMLDRFYDRFAPFRDGQLLGVEIPLKFTLPETPYRLSARIDRLSLRDDGVLEIWDYKTGDRFPSYHDDTFFHQMGIYLLAVSEHYPQFRAVELVQYYLALGQEIRRQFTDEDRELLTVRLRGEIGEIQQASRLSAFPTRETGRCNYCPYFSLCPAKRHACMLEETEKLSDHELAGKLSEVAERYIEMNEKRKVAAEEEKLLKQELVELASELGLSKVLAPASGYTVSIRRGEKESFVTKTADPERFAELSALTQELGLSSYFALDGTALMREIYKRALLPPEQMERLAPFVVRTVESVVTPRAPKRTRDEGEEESSDTE